MFVKHRRLYFFLNEYIHIYKCNLFFFFNKQIGRASGEEGMVCFTTFLLSHPPYSVESGVRVGPLA